MNITYNFGQITETSSSINAFQNQMDQQLNDLYTAFTQLFAADWTGSAGTACDEARQKWNQGATEIKAALAGVGVRLGTSAERMQQVDQQIAANM
ncbi:WXG100 family type VII secretion target [Actinoplanes sp. CA-015351]|uniref:ESAT-6-like protein n=1 Tax=Actinoplanes lutulentus TaxID=1287878 RepID=A0A327ZFX0_9ACTN|nr:WXG100 family type VII secretion target [Actinoplanes lutulentus]MBB2941772.1 WXG100 family type VII secretion target [Actinoplanes lutulentus]RAK39693.1 WXG100 family type VII secretion target [Actinoplanes lutulentus]